MTNREEAIRLAREAGDMKLDPLGIGGLDTEWLRRLIQLAKNEAYKECSSRFYQPFKEHLGKEVNTTILSLIKEPK